MLGLTSPGVGWLGEPWLDMIMESIIVNHSNYLPCILLLLSVHRIYRSMLFNFVEKSRHIILNNLAK